MKPQTVEFLVKREIADVDGEAIRLGSVLECIDPGDDSRGVVVRIVGMAKGEEESFFACGPEAKGDLKIQTGASTRRVTNRYDHWRHVPRENQTYEERLASWIVRPFVDIWEDPEKSDQEKSERIAIDGIMELLPADPVDWEWGPWPDHIEDALGFLARHLAELKGEETKGIV